MAVVKSHSSSFCSEDSRKSFKRPMNETPYVRQATTRTLAERTVVHHSETSGSPQRNSGPGCFPRSITTGAGPPVILARRCPIDSAILQVRDPALGFPTTTTTWSEHCGSGGIGISFDPYVGLHADRDPAFQYMPALQIRVSASRWIKYSSMLLLLSPGQPSMVVRTLGSFRW